MLAKVLVRILMLLAVACSLCVLGCTVERRGEHSITVAGSTSVQPFIEVLAEEYAKERPDVTVNVQGGGSSAGVQAVLTGAAELGMSSRALKPSESAVRGILMAQDAIAVVVHPGNPVLEVDTVTLRKIYTGEITSWQQLGWLDRRITVIAREEGSGTRGAFDEMVMEDAEVWPGCLVQDSNGSVRETVAHDRFAIGYISLGLVNASIRALSIDGVDPCFESASSGEYPLVRPFLFVVKDEPEALAKEFIDFVLGEHGQAILAEEGLIPVNARTAN